MNFCNELRLRKPRRHFQRPIENLESRRLFAATYNVINLAPNAASAVAYGISNNGHVAVTTDTGAAVYFNGKLTPLNIKGAAYDVNDAGQVVGLDSTDANKVVAFVWQNGVETKIPTLGGKLAGAEAINSKGDVVGYAFLSNGAEHAFLYSASTKKTTDLGTLPGGAYSIALGINDSGQIIGNSGVTGGQQHGFFYSNGVMHDLGLLPGGSSGSAYHGITNSGLIAGDSATSGNANYHVYTSQAGGALKDLGTAPNATDIFALDINAGGTIVGRTFVPNLSAVGGAYVLAGGKFSLLTSQLDPSLKYVVQQAYAINDSGAIAGSGNNGGSSRALLMTPITTPPVDTASVAGVVFNDANNNGKQDGSEAGLPNVEVDLTTTVGNGFYTMMTGADGKFTFTQLPAGSYNLTEKTLTGYTQTKPASGGYVVTLSKGQAISGQLFGQFKPAAVTHTAGGTVFVDANNDHLLDNGETGLAGVKVTLTPTSPSGAAKTFTTTGSGAYSFAGLPDGSYTISAVTPAGYTQTAPTETSTFSVVFSSGGGNLTTANFGYFKPGFATAMVGGVVFNDLNGNGTQDKGEAGVAGAVITLAPNGIQASKVIAGAAANPTAISDGTGHYVFNGVTPFLGYDLTVKPPVGYKQTIPAGKLSVLPSPGDNLTTENFGVAKVVVPPVNGGVSGLVFNDADGNGQQNNGEGGLSGVTVHLVPIINNLVAGVAATGISLVTGSNGQFVFANVAPGAYNLYEDVLTGYTQTVPTQDAYAVDIVAGGNITGKTFAQFKPGTPPPPPTGGTVTGTLWNDTDGDGQFNNGEVVTGIRQVFLDTNGNGQLDNGEVSTMSNGAGVYTFKNVAAGTVKVSRAFPAGFHLSNPSDGTGGHDVLAIVTNGGTAIADLGTHKNGSTPPPPPPPKTGMISGTLWNDTDGDGKFDNGEEAGTGIRTVFLDPNRNGKLDAGERFTKSDKHGKYGFSNVAIGTVAVSRLFPAGFHLSNPSAGTGGHDLLVSVLGGKTVIADLGTHENLS